MITRSIAIILGFILSFCVGAQSPSFVADTQKFGVRFFLVPDADKFVELWSRPETPKITLFKEVAVGAEFAGVILYWGGGKNKDGNCDIHAKTTVMMDSEVMAKGQFMPLCAGHSPPVPGVLALGDTVIDLKATGDPVGLVVVVEVTDRVNNETLRVSVPIDVVAK